MALGNSFGGNAFLGGSSVGGAGGGGGFGGGNSGGGVDWGKWVGLGAGLVSIGSGLFRGRKARNLEKNNPYPTASVDPAILENQQRAQQLARLGLPGYGTYLQNIQRNQAGALRVAQSSGRSVNVANILDRTNQATLQLDAADASARMANERLAMAQNSALARENQRVWGWNEAQRYTELAQRIAQLRGAGQQDLWGGIGMLGQLAASGVFSNNAGGGNSSGGGWLSGLFGGRNNQSATNQPGTYGFGGYNTLGNQPTGMAPYYGPMA